MEPISLATFVIPAVAGVVSSFMQSGNNAAAQEEIEKLVAQYGPEARALIERELGGPSAMAEVYGETLAPEAVAAQREALKRMQQVATTGYTPEEEAALRNIQAQTAAQAAGQQATLQQQFAQRGALGSGAQLAMAQQAGQAAAQRAGMQGLDVAAQAQRRAFQAMQGLGTQAGALRQDAVGEAQRRAAADEARRLNRASMLGNVYSQELGAKTGMYRQGAEVANEPWQKAAEGVSRGFQSYAEYNAALDAASKKKGG